MQKLVLLFLLIFASPVYAVQLDVDILNDNDTIEPKFRFLRVVVIEYHEDSQIAHLLDGEQRTIAFDLNSSNSDVSNLIQLMDTSIKEELSTGTINDLSVEYKAILSGNENSATIEYKIDLIPKISGIHSNDLVDFQWRGFSISSPVPISTSDGQYDINNPSSAIRMLNPEVHSLLSGTDTMSILSMPILDASGLQKPVSQWHYLFDPIGILIPDMNLDTVVSQYSMGQCEIQDLQICQDRVWESEFSLDKKYSLRVTESKDDATITLLGYTEVVSIQGIEYFMFREDAETGGPTEDLSVLMMYGMAGIAVVGAIGFFVFSNKKLKNEQGMGQTGINPMDLTSYATSTSSGSYHTNRGESILRESPNKSPF